MPTNFDSCAESAHGWGLRSNHGWRHKPGGLLVGQGGGKVSIVTAATGDEVFTFSVWANPVAIAADSDGNAYVAANRVNDYSVRKYSAAGALIWSFDTGGNANEIRIDSDRNAFVWTSPTLYKINADGSSGGSYSFSGGSDYDFDMLPNDNLVVLKWLPGGGDELTLLDSDLTELWVKDVSTTTYDMDVRSVCRGTSDTCILGGYIASDGSGIQLRELDSAGNTVRDSTTDAGGVAYASVGAQDISTATGRTYTHLVSTSCVYGTDWDSRSDFSPMFSAYSNVRLHKFRYWPGVGLVTMNGTYVSLYSDDCQSRAWQIFGTCIGVVP